MTVTWEAPGPGTWELDAAHYSASVSQIMKDVMTSSAPAGLREGFDLVGAPLATMDIAFVNGRMYRRLVPIIGASRSGTPPWFVLWLATRVHPTFRRRAAVAEAALRDRVWVAEHERWQANWKPELVETNRRLGTVDVAGLSDQQLSDHLREVEAHLRYGTALHFRIHVSDLGPIGRLLVAARERGLDDVVLMDALAGSSPSTSAPAQRLRAIRAELDRVGVEPTSLEEVRGASDDARALLDDYLDEYGHRLTTGYDIGDLTLGELPEVVLASIKDQRPTGRNDVEDRATIRGAEAFDALRSQVDEVFRDEFDELVADARLLYGLRDENGPLTYEWPAGLLRRAVIEAARRLAARGSLNDEIHVFDLGIDELTALLDGSPTPSPAHVADRFDQRMAWCAMTAPTHLGALPSDPPVDVLPGEMRSMMQIILAVVDLLEAPEHDDELAGTGIGSAAYTGTARVVTDADDALDRMQPGDVLVTRLTVPTFNSVLAVAGAVVTENGGLLCHTAVIARELGIAAVVGASGALTAIPDGSTVTVDPTTGTVRVVGLHGRERTVCD